MIKFKDRKNRLLCLGPTHEEEVTEIIRRFVSSYKQLPLILYQIQAKFRDEPRPRFGLLRSCEFIMKDAYSFDRDEEGLSQNYEKMREAYQDIFRDCGLNYVMTEAESGAMGGDVSHEFMVRAPIGEDLLYRCSGCNKYFKKPGQCSDCGVVLEEEKMIEVGHIFKLGTKYSQSQEAYFLDNDGERKPMIMGCYGIGVSRLLPAIVETNYDREGIIWPRNVSPFDISLIILDEELRSDALAGAQMLEKQGLEVLVDDRLLAAGVKFNDTCLIGNPYIAIMGKNYKNSRKIDLEIRKTKDKFSFSLEELANFLKKEYAG
jgi:prolyl-tRNA synthetase